MKQRHHIMGILLFILILFICSIPTTAHNETKMDTNMVTQKELSIDSLKKEIRKSNKLKKQQIRNIEKENEESTTKEKTQQVIEETEEVVTTEEQIENESENIEEIIEEEINDDIEQEAEDIETIIEEEISEEVESISEIERLENGSYGDGGRLIIPDAHLAVGLNWGDIWTQPDYLQYLCDLPDSAAIWPDENNTTMYADHSNQTFANLYNVTVGMTGYITDGTKIIKNLYCKKIEYGHNIDIGYLDENGVSVFVSHPGEHIMYTCNGCWQNILLTYWDEY